MASSKFKKLEFMVERRTESRSSLFYNEWQWAVNWPQHEISVLRAGLDSYKVVQSLANRRYWEKNRFGQGIRWDRDNYVSAITAEVEANIETVRAWLEIQTEPYKMVFNSGHITLYTNSEDFLDQAVNIARQVTPYRILVRQAVVDKPANTVVMKKDYGYGYRTYFRSREMSDQTRQTLQDWVNNMGDQVYACPSLQKFLQGNSRYYWVKHHQYTWDHYFIDHNDAKLDVWMSMVCPGIVRKTMPIQVLAK